MIARDVELRQPDFQARMTDIMADPLKPTSTTFNRSPEDSSIGAIRQANSDCLCLFRCPGSSSTSLDDSYEAYDDDALTLGKVTAAAGFEGVVEVVECGVGHPWRHAATFDKIHLEPVLRALVKAGRRVAVCERSLPQVETGK